MFAHDRSLAPAAQHPCFVASRAHGDHSERRRGFNDSGQPRARGGRENDCAATTRNVNILPAQVLRSRRKSSS